MAMPEELKLERRKRHSAYMREWKKANKDKVNAINRATRERDPERYAEINRLSMAKKRAEDPDRFRKHRLAHRDKDHQRYLLNHARVRARCKGLDFDLNKDDIVIPEFCPVLGMKMMFCEGQRASANHSAYSLDRLDCSKGYVRGNVRVISNRANHLKNNATLAEIEAIAAYMRREGCP